MPTSDVLSRFKVGAPNPLLLQNLPAIRSGGWTPPAPPVPLGQQKRRQYNAVAAMRPRELLTSAFSGHSLPENAQWATRARAQRADIMQQLQRAMTMPNTANWGSTVRRGGGDAALNVKGDFGSFVNAIRRKESGGNYGAVNRHSGALGAYQIMPGNLGPWSREILGRSVSRSEFLSNPRIQDAIAIGKLKQYYQRYGPAGAAVAWYAGPGAVSSKMKSTKAQGQYPSIQVYWQSILGMM